MNKAKERYWARSTVLERLGLKDRALRYYVEIGAPKFIRSKGYPVIKLCEWIIQRPQQRFDKSDIRERARKILSDILDGAKNKKKTIRIKSKTQTIKKPKPKAKKSNADSKEVKLETGLVPALERARFTEQALYQKYKKTLDNNKSDAGLLKQWRDTLEILRKCEKDFEAILENRKELIKFKTLEDWLVPLLEETKTKFLNLSNNVAPRCHQVDWSDAKEEIDLGVREILEQLISETKKNLE